jgi:hypothetical protein
MMMAGKKRWMGAMVELGRQLLVLAMVPAVIGLVMLMEPGPVPGEKRTASLAHDGSDHVRTCTACQWALRQEAAEKAARAVAAMDGATGDQVDQTLERSVSPGRETARRSPVVPAVDRVDLKRFEDCSSL